MGNNVGYFGSNKIRFPADLSNYYTKSQVSSLISSSSGGLSWSTVVSSTYSFSKSSLTRTINIGTTYDILRVEVRPTSISPGSAYSVSVEITETRSWIYGIVKPTTSTTETLYGYFIKHITQGSGYTYYSPISESQSFYNGNKIAFRAPTVTLTLDNDNANSGASISITITIKGAKF